MADPDAWKQNVAAIVGKKNRARDDAETREQSRQDHAAAEMQKARDLLQGQPNDAFREFADYLRSQGEHVEVRHAWDDAAGPWVGVAVSDARGLIFDVRLEARIGDGETGWVWVYEYGGNRRVAKEKDVPSGAAGPSKQDVIEMLANHYQEASANRR